MTLTQALEREMNRGTFVSAVTVEAVCKVCGKTDMLRADTCFDCKEKVETDLIEVWEIANPAHRWPYAYVSQPFSDVSEQDVRQIVKAVEKRQQRMRRNLGGQAMTDMRRHVYISIACVHDQHMQCVKQCRYCDSLCECDCHDDDLVADDNPELQTAAAMLVTQ